MESSIAAFLLRQSACELLPTSKMLKCNSATTDHASSCACHDQGAVVGGHGAKQNQIQKHHAHNAPARRCPSASTSFKLTWLVLGEDPAARSHRVEQFTAL
jgi:hypothetical protein